MGKIQKLDVWFEYDWQYEGKEAAYCVDMTYENELDRLGEVLVTLTCKGKKGTITDGEYRKYEKLRDKIVKKLFVTYVGLIESSDAVRFYFYANTHEVGLQIEKIIKRIANVVACDCCYDKEKNLYKKTLFPDRAKLYTEENRKHINTFAENGDCMHAPRKINFHVFFPSEPLRILFEEQARLSGYAIGDAEFIMEYPLPHGIAVHKICSLNKADIDDATSRLIYIAQKHEGELYFWDCVLVPKRKCL